jgi:hypothetical protein
MPRTSFLNDKEQAHAQSADPFSAEASGQSIPPSETALPAKATNVDARLIALLTRGTAPQYRVNRLHLIGIASGCRSDRRAFLQVILAASWDGRSTWVSGVEEEK